MKKVILSAVLIMLVGLFSCKNEGKKDSTTAQNTEVKDMSLVSLSFGVRGNCNMCKKTIEKAVNAVDGVSKVIWDVDKKKIDVSYDDKVTNEMAIHQAIAASGYDTDKVSADMDAYNNLPGCCQYDHTMAMNQ